MSKTDFAYSVGRVRTLEKLLLGNNGLERMLLAKNAEESFKILDEMDYTNNKAEVEDVQEFQTVLNEGLMEIKEIFDKITPDKEVLNIIWHKYDFHNIKTLIKAKLGERPLEEIKGFLSPLGAIPVQALIQFIMEDKRYVSFNLRGETEQFIKGKILKAYKLFEKEKTPQVIDLLLDRNFIKVIYKIALRNNNEFLIEYVKKLIDVTNIRLFFRMKAAEKDIRFFELAFVYRGHLPFAKFEKAYKGSLADFPESIKSTSYSHMVEVGLKHYEEEKTFIFLEREAENFLTNFIKSAKLTPFGPEPLVAYFLAKENNAFIIRMILINKMNKIDPEEIRERVRDLYS